MNEMWMEEITLFS